VDRLSALRIAADRICHLQLRLGGLGPRRESPEGRTSRRRGGRGLANVAGGQVIDALGNSWWCRWLAES